MSPNLGIDMTGGLQIEYSSQSPVTPEKLNEVRADIIKNYRFEKTDIFSDVMVYTADGSSIRADIGLKTETDTVRATAKSNDIRARLPDFFKKHNIVVTESSFMSVGKSF